VQYWKLKVCNFSFKNIWCSIRVPGFFFFFFWPSLPFFFFFLCSIRVPVSKNLTLLYLEYGSVNGSGYVFVCVKEGWVRKSEEKNDGFRPDGRWMRCKNLKRETMVFIL
jgi:hypothetical protein